jgi:hypothetical protein
MSGVDADVLASCAAAVAERLLGQCNRALSGGRELRFGSRGSLSLCLKTGRWRDFEAGTGGGVLDLVVREGAARTRAAAADWLRAEGLLPDGGGLAAPRPARRPAPPVRDPLPTTDADAKRAFALRIWDTARPAGGTLAEAYLRSRGITLPPPPSLRFAPEMLHSPTATRWPAMVARVEDVAGRFLGVHRTYLAPGGRGKAPVEPQKMMLGATAGGAVRLGEAANGLLIAEGIESALSAMQASGRPAWAALSTSGLRRLELPEHVREVVIVPDGDPPGWDAATAAARRWDAEGWAVRIAALPDGRDINDLLRGGAA